MDNEVFASFVFYSTLLILKMYIIAVITGQIRLRNKVWNLLSRMLTTWWFLDNRFFLNFGLRNLGDRAGTGLLILVQAFANPEDAMRHGGIQYYRQDPHVERYRRAHNNDMENIYPFLFLGAVYSLLNPNPTIARIHFQIFFICRLLHTVAYVLPLKPPTRSVAYSIAQLPCFSMGLHILYSVASSW